MFVECLVEVCHLCYNIWGCMCSTSPFQFRWLEGYIYSSCYYHHQIGSIHLSHCCHIFRGCVPETFVTSYFVRSYSFVCTLHYHHCANLSQGIELLKWLSDIFRRVLFSKFKHSLSVIHYTICGAVCLQSTNFPCDDWENIDTLSYRHQSEVWTIIHCLMLGHETMVYAVCHSIFLWWQQTIFMCIGDCHDNFPCRGLRQGCSDRDLAEPWRQAFAFR